MRDARTTRIVAFLLAIAACRPFHRRTLVFPVSVGRATVTSLAPLPLRPADPEVATEEPFVGVVAGAFASALRRKESIRAT